MYNVILLLLKAVQIYDIKMNYPSVSIGNVSSELQITNIC